MRYLHPDVLDNGHALIKSSAARVLLLPTFASNTTYDQALALALLSVPVSSSDYTISDHDTGRKIVFGGAVGAALTAAAAGLNLHIAHTDGLSRILWVDEETSKSQLLAGQNYRFQPMTLISPQPASSANM